ncbi:MULTISPECIES: NAD(P)H-dependent oxidoreductase [unclassified Streptomyces]|uniref:NADPH-dependent FMN reductase n=1 Tax=unclassified Streptomyces TaxID=2593676 RepID=UPI000DB9923A|nr:MULTISPECIES: NAD(P)H-dependent oxidoreductase [unclassified Streptomyces]MYT69928.1 NADPH-dependent FMN reductase [Streptomyces sp. SID8367]RAJ88501.1 NAD(P)H-dependent FMN reductase [Streptomyces sp. PsTaAH-137]
MPTIGIILGSTRPGRVGPQIARWVEKTAGERDDAAFEVVDIADYSLPLFDEPRSPRLGDYEHDHTRAWAAKIGALDGFVFVTPEYNRSIPAALKNAIDFVYNEWNNKAAGFVGYGSNVGGARALDHLRHIAGAVQLTAVHTQVHLSLQSDFEQYTTFAPAERQDGALRQLLTEVVTLTSALAPLRRA